MKQMLFDILNNEHPEYGIKEIKFSKINATAYFFTFKKGLLSEDTNPYLTCLPESYYDDGLTDWEIEGFKPFEKCNLRVCRLIRDNGDFDGIVYYADNNQKVNNAYKRVFIDRNGYELEFE